MEAFKGFNYFLSARKEEKPYCKLGGRCVHDMLLTNVQKGEEKTIILYYTNKDRVVEECGCVRVVEKMPGVMYSKGNGMVGYQKKK